MGAKAPLALIWIHGMATRLFCFAGVTCVVRLLGSGTAGDHLVLVCGLDLVAILDGDFLDDRPLIYRDREFAVA